jgi:hypothetical protein
MDTTVTDTAHTEGGQEARSQFHPLVAAKNFEATEDLFDMRGSCVNGQGVPVFIGMPRQGAR